MTSNNTQEADARGKWFADLIARLEKATGPDLELDACIRCALFAPIAAIVEKSPFNGAWCIYSGEYQGRPRLFEQPRNLPRATWLGEYTASIDAALTLVPEAWAIDGFMIWPGEKSALRVVPTKLETHNGRTAHWSQGTRIHAEGATAPIAICIAALKARAAQPLPSPPEVSP